MRPCTDRYCSTEQVTLVPLSEWWLASLMALLSSLRLARHGWQIRQIPRDYRHSGCELRCLRMIRLRQSNHRQIQWIKLPPPLAPKTL